MLALVGFGGREATFYEAAALLTAFIILGRYLEAVTRGRTSEAIRPGEAIPVDGIVTEGYSSVD